MKTLIDRVTITARVATVATELPIREQPRSSTIRDPEFVEHWWNAGQDSGSESEQKQDIRRQAKDVVRLSAMAWGVGACCGQDTRGACPRVASRPQS
jgi:hypothetical protein